MDKPSTSYDAIMIVPMKGKFLVQFASHQNYHFKFDTYLDAVDFLSVVGRYRLTFAHAKVLFESSLEKQP